MLRQFRILLVDDDRTHREIYQATLQGELDQIDVSFAEDGEEAWRLCQQLPHPDLIVSDMQMPKLSGVELLHKLKKSPMQKQVD